MRWYEQRLSDLLATPTQQLAAKIFDDGLNDLCSELADFEPDEPDPRGHGKRLPYIGWYWRAVDWTSCYVPIGDCGDFIGHIENNKWGYPQRNLTLPELTTYFEMLGWLRVAGAQGGSLADTRRALDAICRGIWDWFQTLARRLR